MPVLVRIATFLFISIAAATSAVAADSTTATVPTQFDIPAASLAEALSRFGTQSGLQVVYAPELARGLKVAALSGRLTAEAALERLLAGSGLTWSYVNGNTIVLKKLAASEPVSSREDREETPSRDISTEQITVVGVPEILVEGSRSLNTDIKRTEDASQPYVVFESQEILRSQAVNLEDFLRMRLPMNTGGATTGQSPGSAMTVSSIDLRGLGANQTLILVDGRRMPGLPNFGSTMQPDLNGIPLAAVERIEVLPATAGGIYGGSATGGVINVVLRRNYEGMDVKASYANTFDADAGEVRLDASGGFTLEGGRTRIMLSGSYSEANTLVVGDRDFAARSRALQLQNNPDIADFALSSLPPSGATPNIRSVDGSPLVLDEEYGGTPLGSNITHVPLGYAGPGSDNGAALLANAGRYNLDLANDMNGLQRGLLAAPQTDSISLNVRRGFGARVEAFVDLSRLHNEGTSYTAQLPTLARNLPASAPNNPFQQDINVRFPTPGLAFEHRAETESIRATGGVIARLPRDWTSEIDYAWSRSRFEDVSTNFVVDGAATAALNSGLPSADSRPALDALQDGNTLPLDFTPYRLSSPNQFLGPYETILKDVTLRLSGPVLRLPGGALNLSALVEHRDERLAEAFNEGFSPFTGTPTYLFIPHRAQQARSYHLETLAPLVGEENAMPGVEELTLQLSIRRDEYETTGPDTFATFVPSREGPFPPVNHVTSKLRSTDHSLGLSYLPLQDVMLRASYSTGFLPPDVNQIAPSPNVYDFELGLLDPERGDTEIYVGQPITLISGGNPALKPERSQSWSVGLILKPRVLPDFRLSIDYIRIDKVDEIQAPGAQFLLDFAAAFPERIVRGAKLPGDPAEWAGPVISLDETNLNIARTSVEAYDIQANYAWQTQRFGLFRWHAVATWQPHYQNRTLPIYPLVDYVGYDFRPLEWRGNVGLIWDRGPLSVGWNAQLYSSYFAYTVGFGTTAEEVAAATAANRDDAILNQGSARIPGQIYHDLIATYRLDASAAFAGGLLANTELSFGIQNVLDKSPPILASANPTTAGYSPYGDPRLRRFQLSIRKSFGGN